MPETTLSANACIMGFVRLPWYDSTEPTCKFAGKLEPVGIIHSGSSDMNGNQHQHLAEAHSDTALPPISSDDKSAPA